MPAKPKESPETVWPDLAKLNAKDPTVRRWYRRLNWYHGFEPYPEVGPNETKKMRDFLIELDETLRKDKRLRKLFWGLGKLWIRAFVKASAL